MKLYYNKYTRAARPRWMLEELGVPYELVTLDLARGEHKTPEYLAIHPLGKLPALQDGDLTLFESAAICLYLADKYPEQGLAPAPGTPERGAYYQWVFYAMTQLEPPLGEHFVEIRKPEGERDAARMAHARAHFDAAARVLENHLTGRDYVVGETFTTADLILGSVIGWARAMKLVDDHPGLLGYAARLRERPAAQRSVQ